MAGMDGSGKRWHDLHAVDGKPGPHCRAPEAAPQETGTRRMKPLRFSDRFKTLYSLAVRLSESTEADAMLLLLDGPADWARLANLAGEEKVIVAADR